MSTPAQILADPDFKGLPASEQEKVLLKKFPDFAGLPPEERSKVLGGTTGKPAGALAPTAWVAPKVRPSGVEQEIKAPENPLITAGRWATTGLASGDTFVRAMTGKSREQLNEELAPVAGESGRSVIPGGERIKEAAKGLPIVGPLAEGAIAATGPAGFREFVRGAVGDVADTASSFTSPASLAMYTAGSYLKAYTAYRTMNQALLRAQQAGNAPAVQTIQGSMNALMKAFPQVADPRLATAAKTFGRAGQLGFGAQGAHDVWNAGLETTPEAWRERLAGGSMVLNAGAEALGMASGAPKKGILRDQVNALASRIKNGLRPGDPMTAQEIAERALPVVQEAARRGGINPKQFPASEHAPQSDLVGNLMRGGRTATRLLDNAVDLVDQPLQKTVEAFGNQAAPNVQRGVLDDMEDAARNYDGINQELANAVRELARRVVMKGGDINGLNDLKKFANENWDKSGNVGDAHRIMGDAVRANLYPELERLGGKDLTPYTRTEMAVMRAREGLWKDFKKTSGEEADYRSMGPVEYAFAGPLYPHHLARRILSRTPILSDIISSPQGEFNKDFRKALGDPETWPEPQDFQVTPVAGAQPPAGAPPPAAGGPLTLQPPPGAVPPPSSFPPLPPGAGGPTAPVQTTAPLAPGPAPSAVSFPPAPAQPAAAAPSNGLPLAPGPPPEGRVFPAPPRGLVLNPPPGRTPPPTSFEGQPAPVVPPSGPPQGSIVVPAARPTPPAPEGGQAPALPETKFEAPPPHPAIKTAGFVRPRKTAAGDRVMTRFGVVEADDVQPSHTVDPNDSYTLVENPKANPEAQPRNRGKIGSAQQMNDVVNGLDFEQVADSYLASEGAPIVKGREGSNDLDPYTGNLRTGAIKEAYRVGKAGKYRQDLEANAGRFGVDPQVIAGMKKPMLVSELVQDVPDLRQFAIDANGGTVAKMSAAEQAGVDAEQMDPAMLRGFQPGEKGDVSTAVLRRDNADFVREFMQKVVTPAERGSMMTREGTPSQALVSRIRNALFHKAYGATDVLERLAESPDNNIKNITNALSMAAGRIVDMRTAIANRTIQDVDLGQEIGNAAQAVIAARDQGKTIPDLLQPGLEGQQIPPVERALLEAFEEFKQRPKVLAEVLRNYADEADKTPSPDQNNMFGAQEPPAKIELLERAINKARAENVTKSVMERLQQAADSAEQRIKDRGVQLSSGIDPTLLADYAIVGAAKIAMGIKEFSAWSASMVHQFGEAIKPHLNALYAEAYKRAGVKMPKSEAQPGLFGGEAEPEPKGKKATPEQLPMLIPGMGDTLADAHRIEAERLATEKRMAERDRLAKRAPKLPPPPE